VLLLSHVGLIHIDSGCTSRETLLVYDTELLLFPSTPYFYVQYPDWYHWYPPNKKKSSVHRGMYCTRGFVIKLVRPMGGAKSLNGSSVPKFQESRDPNAPQLFEEGVSTIGAHWGPLEHLTWPAVDFPSQNQHFSTVFFCYDSWGRARSGDPNAPNCSGNPWVQLVHIGDGLSS
jgi:hypothetical protein